MGRIFSSRNVDSIRNETVERLIVRKMRAEVREGSKKWSESGKREPKKERGEETKRIPIRHLTLQANHTDSSKSNGERERAILTQGGPVLREGNFESEA